MTRSTSTRHIYGLVFCTLVFAAGLSLVFLVLRQITMFLADWLVFSRSALQPTTDAEWTRFSIVVAVLYASIFVVSCWLNWWVCRRLWSRLIRKDKA